VEATKSLDLVVRFTTCGSITIVIFGR